MSTATNTIEGQVTLTNVRLSFPNLYEAKGIKGDAASKPRFGATFLISKEDKKNLKLIGDEVRRLETKHNKGKALPDKDVPIHDGDTQTHDGYENMMYLSANRAQEQGRPQVVDRDRSPLTRDDEKPLAGDYVNAVVRFYFSDKFGKKVCASLEIVQFVKQGERFGAARADADAALPDLPDDDLDENNI